MDTRQGRYVRVAEIEIGRAQIDAYGAAIRDEIETALRVEPGVLALYAVSDKDDPTHVLVFEIYASESAYQAHLQTPHFRTYKAVTNGMVRSLKLRDTLPIALGAKAK
jgi:quinol monooxygenase YgiN